MVECKAIQFNPIWYFPGGATAYLGGATAYLVGVGVVITRFKAKTQFKLDWTGTGTELSLAILTIQNEFINQGEPLQPPWGIGLTCLQSVGIGIFHQSGESWNGWV